MKNGRARFEFYLDKLEKILKRASIEKNAALWLYKNDARTTLFMLEGLAKLYSGIYKKKIFAKIDLNFKLLEDALGAIDYYDGFAKEFSKDKKIPIKVKNFLETKREEKVQSLNNLLTEKKWIGENANKFRKIRKKLDAADWMDDKAEIKSINKFYQSSIEKIIAFDEIYKTGFDNIETEVHEFRRKLRWLSIYPQALQGCIQLSDKSSKDKNLAKYLTPEIINSPFNKLPKIGENKFLLILNKDYFLSLSWLISELGKLKDEGLRISILNEAGDFPKDDSSKMKNILSEATQICRTFIAEKNLDKLLNGIIIAK